LNVKEPQAGRLRERGGIIITVVAQEPHAKSLAAFLRQMGFWLVAEHQPKGKAYSFITLNTLLPNLFSILIK
jgi:hypothetical protein